MSKTKQKPAPTVPDVLKHHHPMHRVYPLTQFDENGFTADLENGKEFFTFERARAYAVTLPAAIIETVATTGVIAGQVIPNEWSPDEEIVGSDDAGDFNMDEETASESQQGVPASESLET
jgi:hypothetical protein